MKSTGTAAKTIATFLKEQKFTETFGVSGANIEHLFHEFAADEELNVTLARHESMAGMMALGSVKAGQRAGVVLTTSGGASFNVIPALAEAYAQAVPLIALIGQPSGESSAGPFQLSDGTHGTPSIELTLSGVTRWCRRAAAAEEIPELLVEAAEIALGSRGTPGPAALLIPRNLFEEIITLEHPAELKIPETAISLPEQIEAPVTIIAGPQVHSHQAEQELIELAEHLQALVVTEGSARGVFPNSHELFAGVVGTMGHDSAIEAVREATSIFVVGTGVPQLSRYGISDILNEKKIYSIGSKELFGVEKSTFLGTDIKSILGNLLSLKRAEKVAKRATVENILDKDNRYLCYARVIQNALSHGDNIFIDAGNCGAAMVHSLTAPRESLWDMSLSMGGMGYCFGAAVGAVSVNRKRTWVLAGDGSFLMHGMEIHTAVEQNLPITYIIFDNSSHGMCDLREKKFTAPKNFNRFSTELHGEHLGKLISPLTSFNADSPEELESILNESNLSAPLFITVKIPANEPIPFRPLMHQIKETK